MTITGIAADSALAGGRRLALVVIIAGAAATYTLGAGSGPG
jgi:hypothetical protein